MTFNTCLDLAMTRHPPAAERKAHRPAESILLYGFGAVLLLLGFIIAYQFVDPAPPSTLRIATGDPDNAYYRYAQAYRRVLEDEGVTLEVVPSAGSVENLRLLQAGEVDIAFVQGGTMAPANGRELQSLGSLYFEPLWVFHRDTLDLDRLTDLKGQRVAIGMPGSGTRAVAERLLTENGITGDNTGLLALAGSASARALKAGEIDALFLITSARSQLVEELLAAPGVELMSFERAEAYRRRHPFLSSVTLPEGVTDLASNVPPASVTLLAPAATLVTATDFHPALSVLMLQAARRVHDGGGLFEQPGQFPSPRYVDYSLSEDAERFYQSGPPFLHRYLPFWAANLVDRLVVMLIPVITLMLPLSKVLPPTYRWRIRSRIYRWYDQLRELDYRVEQAESPAEVRVLLTELEQVEKEVMQVPVPKSYADALYNLRLHLRLIRERLERRQAHIEQTATPENDV